MEPPAKRRRASEQGSQTGLVEQGGPAAAQQPDPQVAGAAGAAQAQVGWEGRLQQPGEQQQSVHQAQPQPEHPEGAQQPPVDADGAVAAEGAARGEQQEQLQQQPQQPPPTQQQPPPPTQQQQPQPQQPRQQQPQPQLPPPSALGAYAQREEHLQRQEAAGEMEFAYVVNDGSPTNMKRLMGLKVIFSKQLPNMPKEYICRLLLDRRHRSVALVAANGGVIGGITYRVFPQQTFGEIAFCAVAANQQVRGFGTRLMNHTKALARDRDGLRYFLTYADNNAVGYFTKQGFTREITLPREQWVGYIKDYDGGTLMEFVIHPKIPYAGLVDMFKVQREYLDSQIRGLSNSHIVHPGVARQKVPLQPAHSRIKEIALPVKPEDIPGVKEAGWGARNAFKAGYKLVLKDGTVTDADIPNLHTYMTDMLAAVEERSELCWPFLKPVDPAIALDYYDVILDPVDLSLIRSRLGCRTYYMSLEMFVADIRKMCDNCRYYNMPSSDYYQVANKLQAFVDQYLANSVVDAASATAAAATAQK